MTVRPSTSRKRHPALYRQLDQLRSPEEVTDRIDTALTELSKWLAPDAGEALKQVAAEARETP